MDISEKGLIRRRCERLELVRWSLAVMTNLNEAFQDVRRYDQSGAGRYEGLLTNVEMITTDVLGRLPVRNSAEVEIVIAV